jgi:hypothetical protein
MKSVLLLPLALLSFGLFGQGSIQVFDANNTSTPLAANAIIDLTVSAGNSMQFTVDVKNVSASTKEIIAKRYDVSLNVGAAAYFCFASGCYPPQTMVSPSNLTLTPNQFASQVPGANQVLYADLDEGPVMGYSLIRYTFCDYNNPNDSIQIAFRYNIITGVADITKSVQAMSLYPNPSEGNSSLMLNVNTAFNAKLRVFNALGDVVSEQNLNLSQGQHKVDLHLNQLSPGVYLVNLRSGQSTLTKRLVIK